MLKVTLHLDVHNNHRNDSSHAKLYPDLALDNLFKVNFRSKQHVSTDNKLEEKYYDGVLQVLAGDPVTSFSNQLYAVLIKIIHKLIVTLCIFLHAQLLPHSSLAHSTALVRCLFFLCNKFCLFFEFRLLDKNILCECIRNINQSSLTLFHHFWSHLWQP